MKNTKWKPRLTASLFIILLTCTANCFAQGITKADGTYTEPGRYIKDIRYGNPRSDISPKDRSSDRLLDIYLPNQKPPQNDFPFLSSSMAAVFQVEINMENQVLVLFVKQ